MRTLLALALAAGAAAAAHAAEPVRAPDPITAPNAAILSAVRQGDQALMRRLTGTPVTLRAKRSRPLRIMQDYTEFLALTGPDFKLAGGRSGIEVILRIPNKLLTAEPPDEITSSGTITGFELMGEPTGAPGAVSWVPVISVSFLK